MTQDTIKLAIQGQNFQTEYQSQLANALQTTSGERVLQLLTQTSAAQLQANLVILGAKLLQQVPPELLSPNRLGDNGLAQLQLLAQRPQGYPLPIAQFTNGQLQFPENITVPFKPSIALSEGMYAVKIISTGGSLALQLQPVKSEFTIPLLPLTAAKGAPPLLSGTTTSTPNYLVVAQNDISQTTASWLNRLEKLPWPPLGSSLQPANTDKVALELRMTADAINSATAKTYGAELKPINNPPLSLLAKSLFATDTGLTSGTGNAEKVQQATNVDGAQILQKNLSKMGVSATTETIALPKNNLATALMRVLPALSPLLMSELADPEVLQQQLLSALTFQPAQPFTSAPASQSDSVAFMFQLLLGAKLPNLDSNKMSARLRNYLSSLQAASNSSGKLLEALENSKSFDSVSHMVHSIRLFQSASAEMGGTGFYFALPYQLDNHTEQLEGKFEYQDGTDEQQQTKGWKLKLKFSLSSGAMIVNAFVQGKSLRLELASNSELLLDRINNFEAILQQKLTQVGFAVDRVDSYMANIPATLLPGDHVLVKIKV
ncbi:hypothetical protein [Shewanella sp.]|uniref:hypothetical protein n=1 Tax=Shewanella sp. TaxID=50422 RepID=UPI003A979F6B